ncbi:hypothetical protein GCM10010195_47410 [Kitasatospora griseola]|nr:hypothetical protein GCM10010195_47410 [Kitasatospora griseola]
MRAEGTTPEPETSVQSGLTSLGEVACRYQADEIRPEDLPMIAAEVLAAELDTPTLCELAGWPRNADARDIPYAFEQALASPGSGCRIGAWRGATLCAGWRRDSSMER